MCLGNRHSTTKKCWERAWEAAKFQCRKADGKGLEKWAVGWKDTEGRVPPGLIPLGMMPFLGHNAETFPIPIPAQFGGVEEGIKSSHGVAMQPRIMQDSAVFQPGAPWRWRCSRGAEATIKLKQCFKCWGSRMNKSSPKRMNKPNLLTLAR